MNWLQRTQTAHRYEAVVQALAIGALVVAAVKLAVLFARSGTQSSAPVAHWPQLAFGALGLLVGAFAVRYSAKQIAAARAELSNTPAGLIVDLIRIHERELQQWCGAWSLGATAVLATGAVTIAIQRMLELSRAHADTRGAWATLGCVLLALIALAGFGVKRVRYLRRELSTLRDVQRQLD
jgi:hypothetical protein